MFLVYQNYYNTTTYIFNAKNNTKKGNLATTQQKGVKSHNIKKGLKLTISDRKTIQYKLYKLSIHFYFWKFVRQKDVFAGNLQDVTLYPLSLYNY